MIILLYIYIKGHEHKELSIIICRKMCILWCVFVCAYKFDE